MAPRRLALVILLSLLAACATGGRHDDGVVRYRDREIDVRAYFEGFPYKSFYFAPDVGQVLFLRRDDRELLHAADFAAPSPVDLERARPLSTVDFAKRNFWGLAVSSWNKRVYIKGDEDNSEVINLYELQSSGA